MVEVEADIVIWLNQWVGRSAALDALGRLIVSDYFVPVVLSLCLLGFWFTGDDNSTRSTNQKAVLRAMIALGLANLAVLTINAHYFLARPFVDYPLDISLFYAPTDSSFPANPTALSFAMASGLWAANRKMGWLMYGVAAMWGLSRVFAGVFYPLDIIAGALIGMTVSYLVGVVLRLIEPLPTMVLRVARELHLA